MRNLLLFFLASLAACNPQPSDTDKVDPDDSGILDIDGDGYSGDDDCDDGNPDVNVGATETCDGVDNDCDSLIDDDVGTQWYADADSDGFGDQTSSTTACDQPDGYVDDATDCDDALAAVHPGADESDCSDPVDYNCDGSVGYSDLDGDSFAACADCDDTRNDVNSGAVEVCDGVDNNCDSAVDEGVGSTWYADADGDGYGDASLATVTCDAPVGYVADATDCDDSDAAYNPGAAEADCADPNDYNCDGSVGYADADGDGFAACADCDDARGDINSGAAEACDGTDNDCDGVADDGVGSTWYADADADGYGDANVSTVACDAPLGYLADASDCDDADALYNPGAAEADCADPNDYNCDGSVGYADADGDGFAACDDCDDARADINTDAPEACDGADNDCDGVADDGVGSTWYADADADGYGDGSVSTIACDAPIGYVAADTDCDDADAAFNPGASEADCADPNDYNCDGSVGYADADGDGFAACDDCDDARADINGDGTETCDGLDDDCDGEVDEGAIDALVWFADADGDGFGDAAVSVTACAAPAGYVSDASDCDDTDAAYNPSATETCTDLVDYNCDGSVGYSDNDGDGFAACEDCDDARADVNTDAAEACNGRDDDCDGGIDEDSATDVTNWYADADNDGYGDAGVVIAACSAPAGYVADATDCTDTDAAYNPGASESCTDAVDYNCDGSVGYADADGDGFAACEDCDDARADVNTDALEACNGRDDDCDGDVDEATAADASRWFADVDGDGYGDASVVVEACDAPLGYVADATDCDDTDAAYNPGAAEVCTDPNDYNCDGSVGYADADGDGYAACEDCDDAQAGVNADAIEICDGVDNDCDGSVDSGATDALRWYRDRDADGYGDLATSTLSCAMPGGFVASGDDCDDRDGAYNPGVEESCASTVDYNCDGSVGYSDADGDGYAACQDCDDGRADIHAGATETCNGLDDNCDGTVDEATAAGASLWYRDADHDGYGDTTMTVAACDAPAGYVADAGDCDDGDAGFHPGAEESCTATVDANCDGSVGFVDEDGDGYAACEDCDDSRAASNAAAEETCNGHDDDCDGVVDEASAIDALAWFADADGDGFGDPAYTVTACSAPAQYVSDATDCDDEDAAFNPAAMEVCTDPTDYNCDGQVGYADNDGDGYAACADCDDGRADVNDAAAEVCDGIDDDCDGLVDEDPAGGGSSWFLDADHDGFGDAAVAITACDAPAGYVADATDCDDTDAAYNPGALEECFDPNDYNCDGSVGYSDADGDGYAACQDCDDGAAGINPMGVETCNGADDNCDGTIDEASAVDARSWFADADHDGYGDPEMGATACDMPADYVEDATDCSDFDSGVNPGAYEVCDDGVDNDCDGFDDVCDVTE